MYNPENKTNVTPNGKTTKPNKESCRNNRNTRLKKKLKRNNQNKVKVFTTHNPREMMDIDRTHDLGDRGGLDTTPVRKEKSKS